MPDGRRTATKAKVKSKRLRRLAKAALRAAIRRGTVGIVAFFVVGALMIGGLLASGGLLLMQMASILNSHEQVEVEEQQTNVDCPCGCVLVNTGVKSNGSYGFSTGSLASGSTADREALELMYEIEQEVDGDILPMVLYMSAMQEHSCATMQAMYNGGECSSIYTDQLDWEVGLAGSPWNKRMKAAYGSSDWDAPQKCSLDLSVTSGSAGFNAALGPFQVEPAYVASWAGRIPDAYIYSKGYTPINWVSRTEAYGSPYYMPDVIYGYVTLSYGSNYDDAREIIHAGASSDLLKEMSDDDINMAAMLLAATKYNKGTWAGYKDNGVVNTPNIDFVCQFIVDFVGDPEGMRTATLSGLNSIRSSMSSVPSGSEINNVYGFQAFVKGLKAYEDVIGVTEYGSSKGKWTEDLSGVGGSVRSAVTSGEQTVAGIDWSSVTFIGDSLTVGLKTNTGAGTSGATFNAMTGRTLSATDQTGSGVSGEAKTSVSDVKDAKTIVFTLGTNSYGLGKAGTFGSTLSEVLETVHENNPDATIYVGTLPPVVDSIAKSAGYSITNDDINTCNEAIGGTVQGLDYCRLMDSALEVAWDSGGGDHSNDGLHLSASGYEKWWEFIQSAVGGTGTGLGGASGWSGVSSGKMWSCNCFIPCPYCHCHDDESIPNNRTSGGELGGEGGGLGRSSKTFPEASPGRASGLWGTTQQLEEWVGMLERYNSNSQVGGIETKCLSDLLQYMGDMPKAYKSNGGTPSPNYSTQAGGDKFAGTDGYGMICYNQEGKNGEPFNSVKYHDNVTFQKAACGVYATANALSTLTKKWVTPAEVMVAGATYRYRHPGTTLSLIADNGAASHYALAALIREAGFECETSTFNDPLSTNQAKVDSVLAEGGLVIFVGTEAPITDGGHFVVIRDKLSDGTYAICNSCVSRENKLGKLGSYGGSIGHYPWAYIAGTHGQDGGRAIYIHPNSMAMSWAGNTTGNVTVCSPFGRDVGFWYTSDVVRSPGADYYGAFHGGCDLIPANGGGRGAPICAVADGKVVAAGWGGDLGLGSARGYMVVLEHNSGTAEAWCSLYQHMGQQLYVSKGQSVSAGDRIGKMDGSGVENSRNRSRFQYAVHLHIEFWPSSYSEHVNSGTLKNCVVDPISMLGYGEYREGHPGAKIQNEPATGVNTGGYTPSAGSTSIHNLTVMQVTYGGVRTGRVTKEGVDYKWICARFCDVGDDGAHRFPGFVG